MNNRKRNKAMHTAAEAACKTGKALANIAETAGRIAVAAAFGNEAEKVLSPAAHDIARDIELASMEAAATGVQAPVAQQGGSVLDAEIAKLLRTTATAVWRLSGRMLDEETKEPKDEFRRVWRYVESIREALEAIGVETIDWTGKHYDEGLPVKVVAEEERPGTKSPEISETLLPTIRFRKQVQLQQGEVVVGRPGPQNPPTEQMHQTQQEE